MYGSAIGRNISKQFLIKTNIIIHLSKLKILLIKPFLIPKKIDIKHIIKNEISYIFKNSFSSRFIFHIDNFFNNIGSSVRLPISATNIAIAVKMPKYIVG